jgi:uncharacterized protein
MTDPLTTAATTLRLLWEERFTDIHDLFAPTLRAMVTTEALSTGWNAAKAQAGSITSTGTPVTEPAPGGGATLVKVPVTAEHGPFTIVVTVTDAGELAGLRLTPGRAADPAAPWEPPGYADTDAFDEREVTIGTGPTAVPGTLSLPHRTGPGVVLLTGSGPNDRDSTLGPNKPLKDLAWGLATLGIAVLRFDKVTHAHGAAARANRAFTLVDEYLPHALAAIHQLQQHTDRVYVLGHSLGGTVAPRVAAAEPSTAGVVILAGGAQPLHWAAVRQLRHLGTPQSAVDEMARRATVVDSPGLTPDTPDDDLPFTVPAAYWLDLRGYDPVATAAALDTPILVVQGGRDYQVTVDDDLTRWQAGLPDATVRVYPADNHLFFPGTEPSTPAEYETPQHMDLDVITDIATWLALEHC